MAEQQSSQPFVGVRVPIQTAIGNDASAVTEPAPQYGSTEGGQWHV